MNFVGQTKLLDKLSTYTYSTLPHTLLFIGPNGCGKKTVIKMLAANFGLATIQLTKDTTPEQLTDYTYSVLPTVYIINLSDFVEKDQDRFLKFIEEPGRSTYIMLTAESEVGIRPTILNRCIKYYFDTYSKEELSQFIFAPVAVENYVFEAYKTPGQLINLSLISCKALYEMCSEMVSRAQKQHLDELLMHVFQDINCKNNFDKFDMTIFFNMLAYVASEDFKKTFNPTSFKIYKLVCDTQQNMLNKAINKTGWLTKFFNDFYNLVRA